MLLLTRYLEARKRANIIIKCIESCMSKEDYKSVEEFEKYAVKLQVISDIFRGDRLIEKRLEVTEALYRCFHAEALFKEKMKDTDNNQDKINIEIITDNPANQVRTDSPLWTMRPLQLLHESLPHL